jgi:hypothetical protein
MQVVAQGRNYVAQLRKNWLLACRGFALIGVRIVNARGVPMQMTKVVVFHLMAFKAELVNDTAMWTVFRRQRRW